VQVLDPPTRYNARLGAQHHEQGEASASTGAGKDAPPNSDFTDLERELLPPSQEEPVEPHEAAEHVLPPVVMCTPGAYGHANVGEASAYDGRLSSVEGGDGSEASSDKEDFYSATLSDDAEGWPPELLHRPLQRHQRCRRRRSNATQGEHNGGEGTYSGGGAMDATAGREEDT
jgi:hypothetical protein